MPRGGARSAKLASYRELRLVMDEPRPTSASPYKDTSDPEQSWASLFASLYSNDVLTRRIAMVRLVGHHRGSRRQKSMSTIALDPRFLYVGCFNGVLLCPTMGRIRSNWPTWQIVLPPRARHE